MIIMIRLIKIATVQTQYKRLGRKQDVT